LPGRPKHMATVVRSKIVAVGNSRGVRIPRALLGDARIGDEIELIADGDELLVRRLARPRQGWASEFAAMHDAADDRMLDPIAPTRFDDEDWEW